MLTQRNIFFVLALGVVTGYWFYLAFQAELIEPSDLFEGLRLLALDD